MVRIGLVGVVGVLAVVTTGCDMRSDPLNYQSTLSQATRGVVLHDSDSAVDSDAQIGMSRTTCAYDTEYGTIGSDYDYPSESESVDDVAVDSNGDVQVIVTGDKTVHVQQSDGWNANSEDYDVPGAQIGRNFDDGAIVLSEGDGDDCIVSTVGTSNDLVIHARNSQCDGVRTLESDPISGRAWLGSDAGLFAVEGNQLVSVNEGPANIVAYDPYTDGLYTAELNGTVVTALEADGSERWSVDVGASVFSLDDMGSEESVAVSVNYETGGGGVLFLDGWTGELRADAAVATQNNRVVTSRDGGKLSLASADRVEFFTVNPGLVSSGWDVDWTALDGVEFGLE